MIPLRHLSAKCFGMALLGILLTMPMPATASVVIAGTRLIYPAQQREITVNLRNTAQQPALIQAWIDRGDPASRADEADAPFLVTPPLVRIEPEKGQALRIIYVPEALPQDKESLFFFNMLDVPPVSSEKNQLRIAFRTRLKLFFRPEGLRGTPKKAAEDLQWKIERLPQSGAVLHCTNAAAFHVSLSEVTANNEALTQGITVAPGEEITLPLKDGNARITYRWINDFGVQSREEVAEIQR